MRGRRKAGQVEGQATNQGQGGSLPGRLKVPCLEFLENKSVYLVSRHGMGGGYRGRMQGRPGPPGFLFGTVGKSLPVKREEKEARKEEASQVIFQGHEHNRKNEAGRGLSRTSFEGTEATFHKGRHRKQGPCRILGVQGFKLLGGVVDLFRKGEFLFPGMPKPFPEAQLPETEVPFALPYLFLEVETEFKFKIQIDA